MQRCSEKIKAFICRMTPTYRLSINGLGWLPVAVQAAVHVGGVLAIKPERRQKVRSVYAAHVSRQ